MLAAIAATVVAAACSIVAIAATAAATMLAAIAATVVAAACSIVATAATAATGAPGAPGGGCTGVIVNRPAPMPAPQPQPQPAPMPAPAPAVSAAPCCTQRPPAALRLARSTACSIVVAAAVAAKRFADRLHEQREPQGSRSSFPGPLSCRIAPMRIPHARRRE